MGAPLVAPVVVVALAVSAICRDLIASSGLVSVSALLGFLFFGLLKLLVVVVNFVFLLVGVLRWLATCGCDCGHNLPCSHKNSEHFRKVTCKTKFSRHTKILAEREPCKEDKPKTRTQGNHKNWRWTEDKPSKHNSQLNLTATDG
jgi:hypothetical protein